MKISCCAPLVLLALSLATVAHAADEKKDAPDKSKSKVTLAGFNFDESYPEGPGQPGIFGELQPNLAKIIERLDKAAADDKISGILIHLEDSSLGRGKVDELRAAI